MSKEEKPSSLQISIMASEHGILIGRNVYSILGMPEHICILKGEDKQSIAITPCSAKHFLSFKVPDRFAVGRTNSKFRIYSHDFVEELLSANTLAPNMTHKVSGTYDEAHNAVIFPLKVL